MDQSGRTNMKTLKVEFLIDIENDAVDKMKTVIDHHIDYLLDLESFPEIKSVYKAKMDSEEDVQPGWIPCSEKFPSPCVVVLVQTKYSVIATAYYKDGKWNSYPQWGEYTSDGWKQKDLVIGSVIAWRPLPEKYEEVKDERSES